MVSEVKEKARKARKGFTLVELLIVIIIIGILAGAMMLVAGTSRDSAEASKIMSDLRTMKTASLMLISDNPEFDSDAWEDLVDGDNLDQLNNYLDRPITTSSGYIFKYKTVTNNATTDPDDKVTLWVLGLDVTDRRDGVKGNLAKQAASAGLLAGGPDGITADSWPPESDDIYKSTGNYVYVIVQ